ncbi:hypothetical protein BAUCODRAFT_32171 [Baudoinia panamericana UAMH 10762]|uniref:SMP-LTD domain-containing protein n=1 Tax=Baudoinia panamericana (strain UAMH 10762) TaxID=717646 RepID=M2MNB3_BAUPA|nr:uncharacterized protein BAUCODRAFT_32171 [Baudoinia panamericana UAMH 10762]EMC98171.1 hypothetical protein BAUCODRAFT_32171 [Baudoinia panamericana UAMH 10762]
MGFLAYLFVYVFGGLTFLPLVLVAVLAALWALLPDANNAAKSASILDEQDQSGSEGESKENGEIAKTELEDRGTSDGSVAASCTLAVLRSYHLPSAVAALNARNAVPNGASSTSHAANGSLDGAPAETPSGAGSGSESVYQSMYRTVFDRSKTAVAAATSVLEQGGDGTTAAGAAPASASAVKRKPVIHASVFYIVLRHGHLMLYDSASQVEVRHVISLAHHTVSLFDGEISGDLLMDADLFIKRTAIVLTPLSDASANGYPTNSLQQRAKSKPFYLFCATGPEKEDFYHALLAARATPPKPQSIESEDLIKLQSLLHSASLTSETRAFNALVSRVFLALHRTPWLENFVCDKIENKIARVQKPTFIASLAVKAIDLGDAAPVISAPRLKDLNISGDLTLSFDVKYNGAASLVISAVARLDLGTRFKARTIDLLLSTSVQRIAGKMLVRIKPPPSNRIWFCFESMPEMEIHVEPIVSTRKVAYGFVLRAIEERVRAMIGESLVKPNWDDVPFFDTRQQKIRGGIWSDGGEVGIEHPLSEPTDRVTAEALGKGSEKSLSTSALVASSSAAMELQADSSAASSGSDTPMSKVVGSTSAALPESAGTPKRHSVGTTLPFRHSVTEPQPSLPPPVGAFRSPPLTSPPLSAPSVAIDDTSGVAVRSDDAALQPAARRRWRPGRVSNDPPGARKEAAEAIREVRDRSVPGAGQSSTLQDEDARMSSADINVITADADEALEGEDISVTALRKRQGTKRTDTDRSITSTMSSAASQQQQQRKTILANAAAATKAAQNWSWNAIQNRRAAMGANGSRQPVFRTSPMGSRTSLDNQQQHKQPHAHDEPIGRGQPLPPPGTPLPGPIPQTQPRTLIGGLARVAGAAGAGVGGVQSIGTGSVRRKPVPALPPRPTETKHGAVTDEAHIEDEALGQIEDGETIEASANEQTVSQADDALQEPLPTEDDFGPWRENSGIPATREGQGAGTYEELHEELQVNSQGITMATDEGPFEHSEPEAAALGTPPPQIIEPTTPEHSISRPAKKIPPPLPARRRTGKANMPSSVEERSHGGLPPVVETQPKGGNDASTVSAQTPPAPKITQAAPGSEDVGLGQDPPLGGTRPITAVSGSHEHMSSALESKDKAHNDIDDEQAPSQPAPSSPLLDETDHDGDEEAKLAEEKFNNGGDLDEADFDHARTSTGEDQQPSDTALPEESSDQEARSAHIWPDDGGDSSPTDPVVRKHDHNLTADLLEASTDSEAPASPAHTTKAEDLIIPDHDR